MASLFFLFSLFVLFLLSFSSLFPFLIFCLSFLYHDPSLYTPSSFFLLSFLFSLSALTSFIFLSCPPPSPLFFFVSSFSLYFSSLFSVSYISSLSPHTSSLTPFCSLKIFCFSSGIVRVLGVGSWGGKNSLERMFCCEWVTQMEHLSTWKKKTKLKLNMSNPTENVGATLWPRCLAPYRVRHALASQDCPLPKHYLLPPHGRCKSPSALRGSSDRNDAAGKESWNRALRPVHRHILAIAICNLKTKLSLWRQSVLHKNKTKHKQKQKNYYVSVLCKVEFKISLTDTAHAHHQKHQPEVTRAQFNQ